MSTQTTKKPETEEQAKIRKLKVWDAVDAEKIEHYKNLNIDLCDAANQARNQRDAAIAAAQAAEAQVKERDSELAGKRFKITHLEGKVAGLESALRNLSHQ
jgi:hypothetical protein